MIGDPDHFRDNFSSITYPHLYYEKKLPRGWGMHHKTQFFQNSIDSTA